MTRAHDGHAEWCLDDAVYDISVNYEFLNEIHTKKWTSSLKFVVTLALCRYTKIAQRIFKYSYVQYTSLTPDKKNWTVWYIERYFMSTYTGVTNCQKQSGFFWPTLYFWRRMLKISWTTGYKNSHEVLELGEEQRTLTTRQPRHISFHRRRFLGIPMIPILASCSSLICSLHTSVTKYQSRAGTVLRGDRGSRGPLWEVWPHNGPM